MHAEVRKIRDAIEAKRRELVRLRSGDVRAPLGVALARADECIAALRIQAEPWLDSFLGELTMTGRGAPARLVDSRDHRALQSMLVALNPNPYREALHALVRAQYGTGAETIDPDQLPLLIASAECELLDLENRDVALSEKHGEALRPDTAAEAILGIGA